MEIYLCLPVAPTTTSSTASSIISSSSSPPSSSKALLLSSSSSSPPPLRIPCCCHCCCPHHPFAQCPLLPSATILNIFLHFCGHVCHPENQWPHWVICANCTDAFLNLVHSDGIIFWSLSLQTGLSKFPSKSQNHRMNMVRSILQCRIIDINLSNDVLCVKSLNTLVSSCED